jgi:hypothetical protein
VLVRGEDEIFTDSLKTQFTQFASDLPVAWSNATDGRSAMEIGVPVDSDVDGTPDACDVCPLDSLNDQDGDTFCADVDNCLAYATPGNVGILTGDVNVDGNLTSSDIILLVNFTFKGGLDPQPIIQAGDVTCDASNTSSDIIYMVNHVFKGGPGPCDVCALP